MSFTYQDSQTRCQQVRSLPAVEFLWLILQHVLPKGLRRVRDYGLLRGNAKTLRQQIQLMLAVAEPLSRITRGQTCLSRALLPLLLSRDAFYGRSCASSTDRR
ncbi:transposase [Shewanella xiamenensis]|uniref:transposase n=1 Tax=Shewanella xiamenensis TaxID=332186 RepID=UPI003D156CD6